MRVLNNLSYRTISGKIQEQKEFIFNEVQRSNERKKLCGMRVSDDALDEIKNSATYCDYFVYDERNFN